MIIKKTMATVGLVALLSSCATQRFYVSDNPVKGDADQDKMHHFFVGGIGQTQEINAKKVCKGKDVSHVETQLSFLDGLLGGITYGIYTPRTAKVYCKD